LRRYLCHDATPTAAPEIKTEKCPRGKTLAASWRIAGLTVFLR
jgi:hypothetical protein